MFEQRGVVLHDPELVVPLVAALYGASLRLAVDNLSAWHAWIEMPGRKLCYVFETSSGDVNEVFTLLRVLGFCPVLKRL